MASTGQRTERPKRTARGKPGICDQRHKVVRLIWNLVQSWAVVQKVPGIGKLGAAGGMQVASCAMWGLSKWNCRTRGVRGGRQNHPAGRRLTPDGCSEYRTDALHSVSFPALPETLKPCPRCFILGVYWLAGMRGRFERPSRISPRHSRCSGAFLCLHSSGASDSTRIERFDWCCLSSQCSRRYRLN